MKNKEIIFIVDFNNRFSSKWASKPYRSGMDKNLLKAEFKKKDYDISFITYQEINFRNKPYFKNKVFFYTSSEDKNLFYKSYVEDIVLGLELVGADVVPPFRYLRAHHNKTFMEILRDVFDLEGVKDVVSMYYGTYEDFKLEVDKLEYPLVLKSAFGATGKTVALAKTKKEALRKARRFSSSRNFFYDLRDFLRGLKHTGYIKQSKNRRKFIAQNFIPHMDRDYKILIFDKKYFFVGNGNSNNCRG